MCSEIGLKCARQINASSPYGCMKPCTGFIVTSFSKTEEEKNLDDLFALLTEYDSYKKITQYPSAFKGITSTSNLFLCAVDFFRRHTSRKIAVKKQLVSR